MRKSSDGNYRHKGYIISRGSYSNTCDDRSDGWYVDTEESDCWDRRGPGYRTLEEARIAIRAEISDGTRRDYDDAEQSWFAAHSVD